MKKKGLSLILAGILVASAVLNPFSHNTVKAYAEESNNPRVVSEETQANKNYLYLSDIEYVANKSSVGYSSIKLDKNIDNGVIKLIKNGEVIMMNEKDLIDLFMMWLIAKKEIIQKE